MKEGDLLERFIIGFGRVHQLTPEEIEVVEKYFQEKKAAEKKLVDDLKLLTEKITKSQFPKEPLKELPKVLENPRHWTPRNWKPKVKNFNKNINPNFLNKSRNRRK